MIKISQTLDQPYELFSTETHEAFHANSISASPAPSLKQFHPQFFLFIVHRFESTFIFFLFSPRNSMINEFFSLPSIFFNSLQLTFYTMIFSMSRFKGFLTKMKKKKRFFLLVHSQPKNVIPNNCGAQRSDEFL